MIPLLLTVFTASLLGSLHCVGMCGPFAILAGAHRGLPSGSHSSGTTSLPAPVWSAVVGYNLGRLATYLVFGLVCGLAGMMIDLGGSLAGWQHSSTVLAGVLMILAGAIALARLWGWRIPKFAAAEPLARSIQLGFKRVVGLPPVWRSIAIGALTTWMPCGWLYVFAIAAAGVAHPIWSPLTMFAFWAGSVPVMVLLVAGVGHLTQRLRINVALWTAVLVICIGLFTLLYRAPIELPNAGPIQTDVEQITRQIEELDHSQLPCCADNPEGE